MANKWIQFVKYFAKQKGISYIKAMTDEDIKADYKAWKAGDIEYITPKPKAKKVVSKTKKPKVLLEEVEPEVDKKVLNKIIDELRDWYDYWYNVYNVVDPTIRNIKSPRLKKVANQYVQYAKQFANAKQNFIDKVEAKTGVKIDDDKTYIDAGYLEYSDFDRVGITFEDDELYSISPDTQEEVKSMLDEKADEMNKLIKQLLK